MEDRMTIDQLVSLLERLARADNLHPSFRAAAERAEMLVRVVRMEHQLDYSEEAVKLVLAVKSRRVFGDTK